MHEEVSLLFHLILWNVGLMLSSYGSPHIFGFIGLVSWKVLVFCKLALFFFLFVTFFKDFSIWSMFEAFIEEFVTRLLLFYAPFAFWAVRHV